MEYSHVPISESPHLIPNVSMVMKGLFYSQVLGTLQLYVQVF